MEAVKSHQDNLRDPTQVITNPSNNDYWVTLHRCPPLSPQCCWPVAPSLWCLEAPEAQPLPQASASRLIRRRVYTPWTWSANLIG